MHLSTCCVLTELQLERLTDGLQLWDLPYIRLRALGSFGKAIELLEALPPCRGPKGAPHPILHLCFALVQLYFLCWWAFLAQQNSACLQFMYRRSSGTGLKRPPRHLDFPKAKSTMKSRLSPGHWLASNGQWRGNKFSTKGYARALR